MLCDVHSFKTAYKQNAFQTVTLCTTVAQHLLKLAPLVKYWMLTVTGLLCLIANTYILNTVVWSMCGFRKHLFGLLFEAPGELKVCLYEKGSSAEN